MQVHQSELADRTGSSRSPNIFRTHPPAQLNWGSWRAKSGYSRTLSSSIGVISAWPDILPFDI